MGLTGGAGAGKSTVSRMLEERGAVLIDADVLAREVVAPGTSGLDEIVATFGAEVLDGSGALDRTAMAHRVFGDAEARRALEGITHPRVRARAAEIEGKSAPGAVVLHDIPLLVETGQAGGFDTVVVVDAPYDVQVQRLTSQRGMTPEDARARIDAQATRDERLSAADHVIRNAGSLDRLRADVATLWARLIELSDCS